ncbi:putative oxidoreductase C-terminal domain-containing protein [Parapedobacter koreensis]|uniref:Putative oxidoreductase C terminal domain-containing protein n=1 Tax=Parapedobacter koreensis TaxID=332977 RepID=A0A1H7SAM4_9SPHI|nr:putative oxidoreductase C-terminal domain-containing protein [Parapedobacter koreensis]SEL68587.1 Putative oxidoreductase C terminal domain-containing protein [Parapedobacter koreensis]
MNKQRTLISLIAVGCFAACQTGQDNMQQKDIRLVTLAPGHFHAALVQKSMYPEVDSIVHVYAPEGSELNAHLALIDQYNTRADDPTRWEEVVYQGDDFLEKMLTERRGNVVVLAGNNQHKIDYISQSIDAGLNVLADKPMVINQAGFSALEAAFANASKNGVLLYDIMTERYEINTMLQKALSQLPDFFGGLATGSADNPAITKESVHHFFKEVSGNPLIRPAWFYDTKQQGEGLVDVTTHLVDLVQWESFPDQTIDYQNDIQLVGAKRWPTLVTPEQFTRSTGLDVVPAFLSETIDGNGNVAVFANGEINYVLKGVHAKVSVIWNFEAPQGTGDTHYSIMRGQYANLIIRQGAEEQYKPVLYVESTGERTAQAFEEALAAAIKQLGETYEGVAFESLGDGRYRINIPSSLVTTHEEHFAEVTKKYLSFLQSGSMPDWEVPNMIAKYYLTTKALEEAQTVTP